MAKFASMELESCLISDPCVIKSSREVLLFAQKTAEEFNLLTSDLILATVWHCINNSRQIHKSPHNDKGNWESGDKSKSVSGENSTEKQNGETGFRHSSNMSRDFEDNQTEPHNENIIHNSNETREGETLIPILPKDAEDRSNTERESDSLTPSNFPARIDDKIGIKDVSNNEVDSSHSKECVILTADILRVGSESDTKSKLISLLDKRIMPLNEIMANGLKTDKVDGNSNKATELIEQSSTVDSVPNNMTTSLACISDEKDKVKMGNKEHQLLTDVFEIINIDDEDSNESNRSSKQERTDNVNNTSKEEKVEAEPDYFDMDCDEIDDEVNYADIIDTSKDSEVTEHSPRILSKAEETKSKCNESVKDVDVTIISDDEDLEILDLGNKANVDVDVSIATMPSTRSSMHIAKQKSASNVMEVINTPGKEKKGSKRKQIHTNVKVDFSERLQEKPCVNSESETTCSGSHDASAASGFTCSVMDDLDNMSMATQGTGLVHTGGNMSQDPLKLNSDTTPPSAVTVLGLVPVGDVHKSDNQLVCSADDHSTVQLMPTLSSNESIYVSSAMMHGSIPSLPSVSALPHVSTMPGNRSADDYQSSPVMLCKALSSTSSTFQYDPGLQSEFDSIAHPAVSIAQPDGIGSPPRKKRLLDHDKKWHMQPKYSPEQDKYLALPGGVEGTSISEGDGGGADWRQAGRYTSISQYPSIGIESVDSDFVNYQEGYYQSPNQNFNDSSFIDDTSDDIDGIREHCVNNTRLVGGYLGSIKRQRGYNSGTRGRGRGRSRGRGNSNSASTRGKQPAGSRERGKGAVRGGRGQRGRPSGRGSVGTRRGTRGRGKSVKPSTPKQETRDCSPSKYSATKGKGLSSQGRKIGFYSVKLSKSKNTPDSAAKRGSKGSVRRGRARSSKRLLHNVNIKADDEGASLSTDQSHKRGATRSRSGRRSWRGHKTKARKEKDVIVID